MEISLSQYSEGTDLPGNLLMSDQTATDTARSRFLVYKGNTLQWFSEKDTFIDFFEKSKCLFKNMIRIQKKRTKQLQELIYFILPL
jgi:hypothetical protein